ncbi:MAG: 2-amino-4-hydroxy-6-hydroxymethyldihydropteridine diphosphokinase, partial [Desulfobacterales bacterium]|nr:2-amino-4-hydroxy-6-hydroxymethyldihydropteridine diphosphokinase [Desulfobacterales bacterium]
MHSVYISVGSNIGDNFKNCQDGIHKITLFSKLKALSNFYKTEPVDFLDQDWFINGVIQIETELSPLSLLDKLKSVEKDLGRLNNEIRFGPRVLDFDIILYDDLILSGEELVIPHPRMHKRCFVLKPICDINPSMIHPVFKKSMQELLD